MGTATRCSFSRQGARRRRGRQSPPRVDRRAVTGGEVYGRGPNGRRRLGAMSAPRTAATSTKARPRSRRWQGLRGCRNAGHLRAQGDHRWRRETTIASARCPTAACSTARKAAVDGPAISAAAIACLFNAGQYDNQYVPKLQDYCRRNLADITNKGSDIGTMAPLLLRPGPLPRGWAGVGKTTATRFMASWPARLRRTAKFVVWNRVISDRSTPRPSTSRFLQLETARCPSISASRPRSLGTRHSSTITPRQ